MSDGFSCGPWVCSQEPQTQRIYLQSIEGAGAPKVPEKFLHIIDVINKQYLGFISRNVLHLDSIIVAIARMSCVLVQVMSDCKVSTTTQTPTGDGLVFNNAVELFFTVI